MRMVAEKMSAKLGQPFVIDNRPGAAGIIGLKAVMSSPHDGYTLAMIGGGLTAAKALFKSLPYDLERDLIPISTTAAYGIVIATKAGSPLKSVKDVIAAAQGQPGQIEFRLDQSGQQPASVGRAVQIARRHFRHHDPVQDDAGASDGGDPRRCRCPVRISGRLAGSAGR